ALSSCLVSDSGVMSQRSPEKVPVELAVPVTDCDTPKEYERISISFACLESFDSPSIPSIFRNASNGMAGSPFRGGLGLVLTAEGATRVPVRWPLISRFQRWMLYPRHDRRRLHARGRCHLDASAGSSSRGI